MLRYVPPYYLADKMDKKVTIVIIITIKLLQP